MADDAPETRLWVLAAAVLSKATRPMHFTVVTKRIHEAGLAQLNPADGPPPLQVRKAMETGPAELEGGPLFQSDDRGYFSVIEGTHPEDMPPVRDVMDILESKQAEQQEEPDRQVEAATISSEDAPDGASDRSDPEAENITLRAKLKSIKVKLRELLDEIGDDETAP